LSRRLIIGIVIVVLAVAWLLLPSGRTEVLVEPIAVGNLEASYAARGVVHTDVFTLIAPYNARLVFYGFKENEPVHKGDVLARFDAWEIKAQLYDAQAEYWRAEGRFKQVVARLEAHPSDPDGPVWRAEMDADRKELAIRARALDEVRGRVLSTSVASPLDGTLWRRWVPLNDFVHAGDKVLDVVSSEAPWIDVAVSEVDAALVRPDQEVSIRLASGRELPGRVTRVAPALEQTAASGAVLRLRVAPTGDASLLHNGQEVEVAATTLLARSALMAPRSAIVHDGSRDYLVAVSGHRAVRMPVRLGATAPTRVQLLEGPGADTPVVVDRPDLVPDGAAVRPISR
jgi:RND family efflux transporter MFP subunit